MAGKRNYSKAERQRRAERMRELNRSGRAGSRFGHLGGRKRATDTTEEYRARRRKAFEQAQRGAVVQQPKPPIVVTHVQPNGVPAKTDSELQGERAFRRREPSGRYRSHCWRF